MILIIFFQIFDRDLSKPEANFGALSMQNGFIADNEINRISFPLMFQILLQVMKTHEILDFVSEHALH